MVTAPLAVFFDTEFTCLDENFRELISIGFVAEGSEDKLYIVLRDSWQSAGISSFVTDVVLPQLDRHEPEYCTRALAAMRIEYFFYTLRSVDETRPILLLSDSQIDWHLLRRLFENREPTNVTWRLIQSELMALNMNPEYDAAFEDYFQRRAHRLLKRGGERHHALVDAMAMKHAFSIAGENNE